MGVTVPSDSIKIGDNVKIGADRVFLKDVPRNAFVLGNLAWLIGQNKFLQLLRKFMKSI